MKLAFSRQQLVVGAHLLDPTVLEHNESICVAKRAQAMYDSERGTTLDQPGDGLLDLVFRFGVNRNRSLVEDQNARVM